MTSCYICVSLLNEFHSVSRDIETALAPRGKVSYSNMLQSQSKTKCASLLRKRRQTLRIIFKRNSNLEFFKEQDRQGHQDSLDIKKYQ